MSTRTGPYAVRTRTISLPVDNGATVEALITEPEATGVFPGVAFGQKAMGPNRFDRRVNAPDFSRATFDARMMASSGDSGRRAASFPASTDSLG